MVWGCCPAARGRWPAHATGLSWPWWARTVRTAARAAPAVRGIGRQASTGGAARQRTGQPRRGQGPQPVDDAPADQAQSHGTAPARPSMPTKNHGWEDGGNAPGRVAAPCQSIVAGDVTEASHDTPQAEPGAQATLATWAQAGMALPQDVSGVAQALPAT